MSKITLHKVLHYLRGALRGLYGVEDFRDKSVVVLGMNALGFTLLAVLAETEADIYFQVNSLQHYYMAHTICERAEPWEDQPVDIILDVENSWIQIKGKTISFREIGKEPYTQGIHDFYL